MTSKLFSITSWTLTRGCPGDLPMTLLLSPERGWAEQMNPLFWFNVDIRDYWGFPEAI